MLELYRALYPGPNNVSNYMYVRKTYLMSSTSVILPLYADDTVLYFSWKCISEIKSKLNSYLRHICDWMKLNQHFFVVFCGYLLP